MLPAKPVLRSMFVALSLACLIAAPYTATAQRSSHSLMLYSNSPESVSDPALLYQSIAQGPCRLLFHHLNVSRQPMILEVRISSLSEQPTALLYRIYTSEHTDPTQAGHYAAQKFWLEEQPLYPTPGLAALGEETLTSLCWMPGVTISGLAVLNLPQPAMVRVIALPATGKSIIPSRPLCTASFPLTDLYEEIPYTLPRDPLVVSVGRGNYLNNSTTVLRGNYGVIHHYRILAVNPTDQAQRLSIYTRQAGGVSRAFVRVDDELLSMPTSRTYAKQLLTYRIVPPRSQLILELSTMPQAGSNMPIDFLLESSGPEPDSIRLNSEPVSRTSQ